jgi:hypothetical protein
MTRQLTAQHANEHLARGRCRRGAQFVWRLQGIPPRRMAVNGRGQDGSFLTPALLAEQWHTPVFRRLKKPETEPNFGLPRGES